MLVLCLFCACFVLVLCLFCACFVLVLWLTFSVLSLLFFFLLQASFVTGAGHTQACAKARFSANDERLITIGMHDRSIFQWKVILTGGPGEDAPAEKGSGKSGGGKKKKKKKGK